MASNTRRTRFQTPPRLQRTTSHPTLDDFENDQSDGINREERSTTPDETHAYVNVRSTPGSPNNDLENRPPLSPAASQWQGSPTASEWQGSPPAGEQQPSFPPRAITAAVYATSAGDTTSNTAQAETTAAPTTRWQRLLQELAWLKHQITAEEQVWLRLPMSQEMLQARNDTVAPLYATYASLLAQLDPTWQQFMDMAADRFKCRT